MFRSGSSKTSLPCQKNLLPFLKLKKSSRRETFGRDGRYKSFPHCQSFIVAPIFHIFYQEVDFIVPNNNNNNNKECQRISCSKGKGKFSRLSCWCDAVAPFNSSVWLTVGSEASGILSLERSDQILDWVVLFLYKPRNCIIFNLHIKYKTNTYT